MMRQMAFLIIPVLILSGCAKVANMQELLILKAYSDSGEEMDAFVAEQDAKFEKLLALAKEDNLKAYAHQDLFLKDFGNPVFKRDVVRDGRENVLWLYRYAMQFKGSPKVYLYFDKKGSLVKWELYEGE